MAGSLTSRPRDDDAMGHAAIAAHRGTSGHQHPQHVVAALADLVEAGEPLPRPGEKSYRFRKENALRAIEAERGFAKRQADTQTATRITLAPPHKPSAAR